MTDHNQSYVEKKVDAAWKETVDKEKITAPAQETNDTDPMIEASFPMFISGIGMQALMALGDFPRDEDGKGPDYPLDLKQARYLIDCLNLLKEKTTGNLNKEEEDLMNGLLYDLQMRYVAKSQTPQNPA